MPPPPPPLLRTAESMSLEAGSRRRGVSMVAPGSARFSGQVSNLPGGRAKDGAGAAAGGAVGRAAGKGKGKGGKRGGFGRVSMVPSISHPASRFRRRVASMPDVRVKCVGMWDVVCVLELRHGVSDPPPSSACGVVWTRHG